LRTVAQVIAACTLIAASGVAAAAPVAIDRPDLQAAARLQVSLPGVADGGPLPTNYAFDGRNLSPPISWSDGPPQTRSFVVLMQDADAPSGASGENVNWSLYSIPPTVLVLPRGLRNVASPTNPLGASQGRNSHDSLGYTGPHLAVGEPAHHYHLQVFALDRPLRLRPGAELPAVLKAMSGHVVARGELVATYAAPSPDAARGHQQSAAAPPAPGS
jgi:Raf kinase inhibitor-like YbhB/YbcL family protein